VSVEAGAAAAGGAAAAIDSLDHVAITVADMDRSLAFYAGLLGCEVLGQLLLDGGTFKLVYLRKGRALIELFAHRTETADAGSTGAPAVARAPDRFGFEHLAFHSDDVDGVAAALAAAGVPFSVTPKDAAGNVRLAFIHDPDGNTMEVVSNLPEMEPYRSGWS
jgi:glyoxylase I family protein